MTKSQRAPWLATPLVAAIAFVSVMGLAVMIDLGDWLRTSAFVLFVATIAVVTTRLLSRQRTLPSLVGMAVTIIAMVPIFAVSDAGESHLWPTPGALSDLGAAIRAGVEHAATTVAPAPSTPGFTALITLGMVALFLAADYLAVSWRAGATAGLVLLVPWMPAVIFQHRVSTTALIGSIALWLVVLALTRERATPVSTPAYGGALVATAATLAGVLLIAPTALGGLGWGVIPRIDTPAGLNSSTRLNLALDLRTSLTANSTSPVLVYDSTGTRPAAFKLYALTDFDGVQWDREETALPTTPATGGVLWPTPIDSWTDRERTRLEVQVLDLQETNLPLPPTPRVVDIDGSWYYNAELDEVVGADVTARDARYSVETDPDLPAREDLQALAAGSDPSEADLDPRYLTLAPAIDQARLQALALDLTSEETTRYGQAMALQSHLRNTNEFTYDTSVDPTGNDAVSTFLDDREGYCVQFATTMVMMARTLDIPSRMALGFLPGTATDQDSYVVQGGDAHVWPELWFPDHGWVRFEPTPAIQTGAPPPYADPLLDQPSDVNDVTPAFPEPAPVAPQEPDTAGIPGQDVPGTDNASDAAVPVWAWVAIGVVVVAAAVALWVWRARAGSRWRKDHGPEVEWESLRSRLPVAVRWGADLTPHEAAEHVRAHLHHANNLHGADNLHDAEELPSESDSPVVHALTAITAFAHVVADHRYAPAGSHVEIAQLREWANHVVAGVKAADRIGV